MLRSNIDHCLETRSCVHNLQRGTIRQPRLQSGKVHENLEKFVMTTVRMQTKDREATTVVLPEAIASGIAIGWETAAVE